MPNMSTSIDLSKNIIRMNRQAHCAAQYENLQESLTNTWTFIPLLFPVRFLQDKIFSSHRKASKIIKEEINESKEGPALDKLDEQYQRTGKYELRIMCISSKGSDEMEKYRRKRPEGSSYIMMKVLGFEANKGIFGPPWSLCTTIFQKFSFCHITHMWRFMSYLQEQSMLKHEQNERFYFLVHQEPATVQNWIIRNYRLIFQTLSITYQWW